SPHKSQFRQGGIVSLKCAAACRLLRARFGWKLDASVHQQSAIGTDAAQISETAARHNAVRFILGRPLRCSAAKAVHGARRATYLPSPALLRKEVAQVFPQDHLPVRLAHGRQPLAYPMPDRVSVHVEQAGSLSYRIASMLLCQSGIQPAMTHGVA